MLANTKIKKAVFSTISTANSLLQNHLLNHRVHFDFKTETVEYRLRLLPVISGASQQLSYVKIDFTYQGQPGIAYCESNLVTALMDLEASDFDISKLTDLEKNAAFAVVQRMIEENSVDISGLTIQKIQLAPFKLKSDFPLQLVLKVTSVEHFSYIYLQLNADYTELLLPAIENAAPIKNSSNLPEVNFTQDLEVYGCKLSHQELSSLEIGDILMFDQSATDYRIRVADYYCFSLSPNENGLSLLPIEKDSSAGTENLFEISVKLHQALINDAEDDSILQVAQQQLEHSQHQPLKTLYCNQAPFALAEGMYIGDRFGMRLQNFL